MEAGFSQIWSQLKMFSAPCITQSSYICPTSPVSHVVIYSWLSTFPGKIEVEDYPNTCRHWKRIRNRSQLKQPGNLLATKSS